jgi:hypothetical protein
MPKTKVFLTWSGTKSKQLSQALREWLPQVIQNLEPWMSDSDLDKGSRWASEIAGQLEQAQIGIICLTPENIEKPWINFEAGALSKQLERSRVCPYLLGLSPSDLTFPLAQFHATIADKHETLKMLQSINKTMGESGLPEQALDSSFTMWWPKFKARIDQITQDGGNVPTLRRTTEDMLEEILNAVRAESRWHADVMEALETIKGPRLADSSFWPRLQTNLTTYLDGGKVRLPKEDWWKLAEILGRIEAQTSFKLDNAEETGEGR